MTTRKKKFKLIRLLPLCLWLLIFPSAIVKAEGQTPGLSYRTFISQGGSPELPTESDQPLSQGTVPSIDFDWGGGYVLDSGRYDGVIVEFTGWILPPDQQTYYLCGLVDDGFKLYLDNALVIDDWWDKGPSCGNTADVDFSNGQAKQLLAYMYENGGGAVATLMYFVGDGIWLPVPASWYSFEEPEPVVTTTTTTPEETTTTIEETTTTIEETTTTIEETTTTEVEVTTTLPEEVVTTTQPEDTMPPSPPVVVPPSDPAPEPEPEPTPEPAPEPEPIPEPESPEEPVQEEPAPEEPSEPENPSEEPTDPSEEEPEAPTEQPSEPTPIDELPIEEIVNNISEIQAIDLSPEQIEVVFSPEVLSELSEQQVEELIANIDPDQLSSEQAEALSEALSAAPENVKKEFENEINIFGGQFDTYVPIGSKLSVGERRIIIAVTAAIAAMPAPSASRRK